jgi:hypothetical protein
MRYYMLSNSRLSPLYRRLEAILFVPDLSFDDKTDDKTRLAPQRRIHLVHGLLLHGRQDAASKPSICPGRDWLMMVEPFLARGVSIEPAEMDGGTQKTNGERLSLTC